MRTIGVWCGIMFAAGSVATGQVPGGQPPVGTPAGRVPTPGSGQGTVTPVALQPQAPPNPIVVAHLKAWEKKMAGLQNLYATCEQKQEDRVLKKVKTYTGSVVCMKPNLARMSIALVNDPKDHIGYLCDGKAVYEYNGLEKKLTQYNIPPGASGVGDNLLMEFMSGSLTADDVLRRFDIKILTPAKPDANYLYFEVKPRLAKDKQDFETLKLVFFSPELDPKLQYLSYLPAMVEIAGTNNERVLTWSFVADGKLPQPNVNGIKAAEFKPVNPGKDWQIVVGNPPAGGQGPRVVRPTGPVK
jgi:TIGR03009 family protein